MFILVFVAALTTCNCPGKVEEAIGVIPAMSISIIINLKVDLILIFSFILSLLYFKGATALHVLFIHSLEMFIFSLWGLTPVLHGPLLVNIF